MPFLNDQELEDLQQQIKDLNSKNEDLENELSEKVEEIADVKSVSRNRNILLSFLAGICLAFAYFSYQGKFGNVATTKTSALNQSEIDRIIDSVKTASADDNYQDDDYENDEESEDGEISSIKDGIQGKTIYSVQIGAFSEKKYPLLSKTIAGNLSNDEYIRYSIGLFETLKEAQNFRRQLLKYGFEDAFVASYINGQRQQIHKPY